MSGPKGYGLSLERRIQRRLENRDFCTRVLSEYTRIRDELTTMIARFRDLGGTAETEMPEAESLRALTDALLAKNRDEKAATECSNRMSALRNERHAVEKKLNARIAKTQERFRTLKREWQSLKDERKRLETEIPCAIPTEWPEGEQKRIRSLLKTISSECALRGTVKAGLDKDAVLALKKAEKELSAAQKSLENGRKRLELEINETHIRLVSERIIKGLRPPKKISEILKGAPVTVPESRNEEDKRFAKLDSVLAEIGVLRDTAGWEDLMRRADEIRDVADPNRRQSLLDSLMIDCDRRLTAMRESEKFRNELQSLIDRAVCLRNTVNESVLTNLESLLRSGRTAELAPLGQEVDSAIADHERRAARAIKRKTVLDALTGLGYQPQEGLETSLVTGGKLVFQKPDETEYAVEVVVDNDLNTMQTRMLRYAETEEMSVDRRLRDKERESAWCGEHAKLVETLEERGLELDWKLRIPPGDHPVKIVIDHERAKKIKTSRRAGTDRSVRTRQAD